MVGRGLAALDWLIDAQTSRDGHLSPIGNDWWPRRRRERSTFDQQPIEATALLLAAESASSVTGDASLRGSDGALLRVVPRRQRPRRSTSPIPASGACCDGLDPTGVNLNEGAESTLMWLIAAEHIRAVRAADPRAVGRWRSAGRDVALGDPAGAAVPARSGQPHPDGGRRALPRELGLQPGRGPRRRRDDPAGPGRGPPRDLPAPRRSQRATASRDWRFDPEPLLQADVDRDPEETWGCEDPRITWLPERDEWAIAYTAYSRRGPLVGLATTRDFRSVHRLGPVMPPEDKDAALFPRRLDGRWAMIHRPSPLRGGAHMWLSYSPDLRHWGDHKLLIEARDGAWWDAGKIGLGPAAARDAPGLAGDVPRRPIRPPTARSTGSVWRCSTSTTRRRVLHRTDTLGLRSRGAVRDHRRRRPGRVSVRLGPRSGGRPTPPLLRRRGLGDRRSQRPRSAR